ncbi:MULTISPECIES: hypothetical protein [unclassified Methanoregula]|uniref:hypothetical protein n=1 Tax=unclassified Methanoregula TaxID=2649730 RepID=UPI0009C814DC|nr:MULTISPECIES: hypothetical protein [unclassified Methanoregula]OPX65558.1 MAG: hypothetical protein A4E33_00102 [Methanoregula sp. PtaB.Bin085]OPY35837.1 MAG: hypothetical protein A4E34_00516 [Methanoregula sp. PtaU1.Bin006]
MSGLRTVLIVLILLSCSLSAGCIISSGKNPAPPAEGITTISPSVTEPAASASPGISAAGTTAAPQETVTVVRYVPRLKDLRDPELLFAIRVPAEWNVSTWRLMKADLPDYRTDLVSGGVFSVWSYPSSRSREQAYRDQYRLWSPAPTESTVTINGIRYDRFESRSAGNTSVAYIMDTNSANERGYAGVLVFTARDCNRFELEDFEQVVSSFRYYPRSTGATVPGTVIPLYDLTGAVVPPKDSVRDVRMFDSSDWDGGGGSASDGVTAGQEASESSSSGGSSSGGGCHR